MAFPVISFSLIHVRAASFPHHQQSPDALHPPLPRRLVPPPAPTSILSRVDSAAPSTLPAAPVVLFPTRPCLAAHSHRAHQRAHAPVGTLTRLSKPHTPPPPRIRVARRVCGCVQWPKNDARQRVPHHPRLSVALTHPGLHKTRSVEGEGDRKGKRATHAGNHHLLRKPTESAIMHASRRTHRRTDSRFRERREHSNRVRKNRGARWTRTSCRTRAHAAEPVAHPK
ncbi:hypothetical protein C8R43DRAFT_1137510 [Mycena crocata]|nr:hypothetical protein C8R43DRAFT_1137510 [Mycena crocata]